MSKQKKQPVRKSPGAYPVRVQCKISTKLNERFERVAEERGYKPSDLVPILIGEECDRRLAPTQPTPYS